MEAGIYRLPPLIKLGAYVDSRPHLVKLALVQNPLFAKSYLLYKIAQKEKKGFVSSVLPWVFLALGAATFARPAMGALRGVARFATGPGGRAAEAAARTGRQWWRAGVEQLREWFPGFRERAGTFFRTLGEYYRSFGMAGESPLFTRWVIAREVARGNIPRELAGQLYGFSGLTRTHFRTIFESPAWREFEQATKGAKRFRELILSGKSPEEILRELGKTKETSRILRELQGMYTELFPDIAAGAGQAAAKGAAPWMETLKGVGAWVKEKPLQAGALMYLGGTGISKILRGSTPLIQMPGPQYIPYPVPMGGYGGGGYGRYAVEPFSPFPTF